MKSDVKKLWLEALRSGEYEQGRSALANTNDEYCCLGVLCQLAVNNGVPIKVKKVQSGLGPVKSYDDAKYLLPQSVQEWAGLESSNPVVQGDIGTNLADMNDRRYSFDAIARVIEEEL